MSSVRLPSATTFTGSPPSPGGAELSANDVPDLWARLVWRAAMSGVHQLLVKFPFKRDDPRTRTEIPLFLRERRKRIPLFLRDPHALF